MTERLEKMIRFTDIPDEGISEYYDLLNRRAILIFLDENKIPYQLKDGRRGYKFLYIQEQDLGMVKKEYVQKLKRKKHGLSLH